MAIELVRRFRGLRALVIGDASIEILTLVQALRWHGHQVTLHRHLPQRGMAEQRNFLVE